MLPTPSIPAYSQGTQARSSPLASPAASAKKALPSQTPDSASAIAVNPDVVAAWQQYSTAQAKATVLHLRPAADGLPAPTGHSGPQPPQAQPDPAAQHQGSFQAGTRPPSEGMQILVANGVREVTPVLVAPDKFQVPAATSPALLDLYRSLNNASYDVSSATWTLALSHYELLVGVLPRLGHGLVPLPHWIRTLFLAPRRPATVHLDRIPPVAELLNTLYPFQRLGVIFGVERGGRVLIGDEMGLGKTVQALALALYYQLDSWPVLVLCPPTLKAQWVQHWRKYVPAAEAVERGPLTAPVMVMSTEMGKARAGELLALAAAPMTVILDESHSVKDPRSKRALALLPLLKSARRLILLSGTPAVSRPAELWTQLAALRPDLFPDNGFNFKVRYCAGRVVRHGRGPKGEHWDFSGASHLQELHVLLSALMVRRHKADVLTLPNKSREKVMVTLDPVHLAAIEAVRKQLSAARARAAGRAPEERRLLLELFRSTATAKIPAVTGFVREALGRGSKLLVFAHHQDMLDALEHTAVQARVPYIRIDGRTPQPHRPELVQHFQAEASCRLALLSMTAAGVGLTLTAAAHVVFAELYYVPGVLRQCEDRAHRIGQTEDVLVQYLVARGTDELVWAMVEAKLEVLGQLLDGAKAQLQVEATSDLPAASAAASDLLDAIIERMRNVDEILDGQELRARKRKERAQDGASRSRSRSPSHLAELLAPLPPLDLAPAAHELAHFKKRQPGGNLETRD